jgi:AraC family transcriptional regulator
MTSAVVPRIPTSTGTIQSTRLNVPGASVTLARFPAALRLPPHAHEKACLTVLLDGVMTERIRGRERYCEQASVLIKPGLERHDDLCGQSGSTQIIVEPDNSDDALLESSALLTSVQCFRDADAERVARRLSLELEQPDAVTPVAAAALTWELFAILARRGLRTRPVADPPRWLQLTHEQLQDNVSDVPTLAALARKAGVHPAHLARAFRAHYGCSIGSFIRTRRIRAAAEDLATTDVTIAGIATAHGFSDQSHFTRLFRRQLGLTPRVWRERFRSR